MIKKLFVYVAVGMLVGNNIGHLVQYYKDEIKIKEIEDRQEILLKDIKTLSDNHETLKQNVTDFASELLHTENTLILDHKTMGTVLDTIKIQTESIHRLMITINTNNVVVHN